MPYSFCKNLLDHKHILRCTPNREKLKITLRKIENKGIGIVARRHIKKGEVVAYYKVKIYNTKTYVSPTKGVYQIEIYDKKHVTIKRYIGDIYNGSIEKPYRNIPFWGHFSNEPSKDEEANCILDPNIRSNYKKRDKVSMGDNYVYKLITKKPVAKGEELMWHYGDSYERKYKAGKE